MPAPTGSPAIATSDLTKSYGAVLALDGLDLEVSRGEVFGFLGPNGAGKTTAIRLLLDLIRPTRGRATVLGHDARRESIEVRRRTGYLPGELRLPERQTARQVLAHLAALRGRRLEAEVGELAERLGLELDRRIGDLSKGNKQKIGVAAAFMHDPELLVLDEPASGLDPLRQRDVQELMRERAARGRTVLLSSHALDQVEDVAGRVAMIRAGRLIAVDEVAALKRAAVRAVVATFEGEPPTAAVAALPGVADVRAEGSALRFTVAGPVDPLIKELARHRVLDLTSAAPDLDEIFRRYYEG